MFPEHFSYKKLEEFIGRETILNQVKGWLEDSKFHPVFISAEYGIGKTRLLNRILELQKKYDGAPARLIDLYHFQHHSPEGLARAIFASFEKTENEHYFNPFITARRRLDVARVRGDSQEIHEILQKLLVACADGVKKVSADHGVLLLFDTAEQFVYPTGARFAPAWDWLKGWISDLPRGAALFAGRPEAKPLFQEFQTIPLDGFTLEESNAYLEGVNKRWFQETGQPVSLSEEDVQKLYTLSEGRPILLAIFLESRMRNPQAFKELSKYETETFAQKVIEYLLSQPELGETLKAAGRTHKGINVELLVKIRGIPHRDAKEALEMLQNMSFAKTFPDDEYVYLHDDMYDLLDRYVYSDDIDAAERQTAAQAIYDYYKSAMKQKNEELRKVFEALSIYQSANSTQDYVSRIRKLEASRQHLKTEFIYYRLRYKMGKEGKRRWYEDDPIFAGLRMYYRYGHEAATSNNDEILIPLQIELINFWLNLADGNFWKPFIEGLLLIHEVWLKVATGQNYQDDIPSLKKSLSSISGLSANQKAPLHALLDTWLGTGMVFAKIPEYESAEEVFTKSIEGIQKINVDQRLQWFKAVAISLSYRQRAYMRRIRGAFQGAIDDFLVGLHYNRSIDFYHEEATLRNDLGFAQMQNGFFQPAIENIEDGLRTRYKTAIGHRIALSYSTLAQYYISKGTYEEARKYAHQSIGISDAVGFRRGLAFGNLAFAEATRRFAFSAQGSANQVEHLEQSKDAVEIAIQILEQLGEKARIIEARLEEACLYRDRVRIETESFKKKTWFEKSNLEFLEVAKEAEEFGIKYRLVDAMCNRIWLGYYVGNLEFAKQAIQDFEVLEVLKPYWLKNGKFVDEAQAQKEPILWSQIGKYNMALGIIALETWKKSANSPLLEDAALNMMLSMTYSVQFATDHRGLREGRRTIYQALAPLNPEELNQFCQYVLNAEKTEKIKKKPSALQSMMQEHALWFAD